MAEVRLLSTPDVERALDRLRDLDLNFDPTDLDRLRRDPAWHVDHYRKALPAEPAGEPVDGGGWSAARHLSMEYEFVDPRLVHAFFDPKAFSRAPPERVCQMVQDLFTALLAIKDGDAQDRLLVETLRHVMAG